MGKCVFFNSAFKIGGLIPIRNRYDAWCIYCICQIIYFQYIKI